MDENLVGYLLNALEPEQQREVEQHLDAHPATRQKLEVLRRALEPLAADKEPPEPPAGLAYRTLSRVAEYRCRPQHEAPAPPPTPPVPIARAWYRRADILIAASLLILIGGLAVPGLVSIRSKYHREACANNLQVFYRGLSAYAANHDQEIPVVGEQAPYNRAGIFVPRLREEGVLPADASVRCPANSSGPSTVHTLKELEEMARSDFDKFEQIAKELSGCYAYSLGYIDASGQHRTLRRGDTALNDSQIPIMADKPSVRGNSRGNSLNHHGQNVLYMDGSTRFHTTPNAGVDGDHIYLNKAGKVAAGLDQWDTVLGRSEDKPYDDKP
jgi:hypothetical protein